MKRKMSILSITQLVLGFIFGGIAVSQGVIEEYSGATYYLLLAVIFIAWSQSSWGKESRK